MTTSTITTMHDQPGRDVGEHDDGAFGVAGVNHVSIVTDDLERIARFYAEVFDCERIDIPAPPGAELAAVVRLGPRAGIAFVQAAGHPFAAGSTQELARGHVDHVALDASSLGGLERARDRLVERGASDGRIRDYGPMLCVTFTDPDGMGSEICWLRDPSLTGLHPPVLSDRALSGPEIAGRVRMAVGRFDAVDEPEPEPGDTDVAAAVAVAHAGEPPEPPAWQLARLMDGFVVTQLLYVAAKLGLADELAAGPRSGPELGVAVGADPAHLTRVLRGLAAEGVLAETGDGRFGLTPLGEALRSLQGAAIARGELYYDAASGLLDAVREGGVAFERCHGRSFFDHLRDDPAAEAVFHASMAGRARQEAQDVVDAYDFAGLRQLVDVGGGSGVLLAGVLRANESLVGTLVDRPAVIAAAQAHLDDAGVGERARCLAGDFFDDVPAGADAYVLSRVLHDWDDHDAGRILDVCRRRMSPDSRLLIVDALVPERAGDAPAAIRMDLHMLLLFGARERTESELRDVCGRAGLEVRRRFDTRSPAGLAVLEAVPIQVA